MSTREGALPTRWFLSPTPIRIYRVAVIRHLMRPVRRMSAAAFTLLAVALAGGGVVLVLIANNAVAAGAFTQARLHAQITLLRGQAEQAERDLAIAQAPAVIAQHAEALGMRPAGTPTWLDHAGKVLVRGEPTPSDGRVAPRPIWTSDAASPVR